MKRYLILFLLIVFAFGLGACGRSNQESKAEKEKVKAARETALKRTVNMPAHGYTRFEEPKEPGQKQ
jgi:ABC-type enterochelin transport system substrate-binding protein